MKQLMLAVAIALIPIPPCYAESFTEEQIAAGAEVYAVNCSPCHGARMQEPGSAFNLRKFPPDQRERFARVGHCGKNWGCRPRGDFFKLTSPQRWAACRGGRTVTAKALCAQSSTQTRAVAPAWCGGRSADLASGSDGLRIEIGSEVANFD